MQEATHYIQYLRQEVAQKLGMLGEYGFLFAQNLVDPGRECLELTVADSDFPRGANLLFGIHFCRKLHENKKKWTEGGAPLDLPLTLEHCTGKIMSQTMMATIGSGC